METETGKLFIGGISWDTSEDRMREYFKTFGEVVEAVIMKDRATGRARGFGFVVFADASIAEKVVKGRHIIDGRTVEAKKAVPRDDHQNFNRSNGSIQGSPGPARTKKIFVGGLASSVTESDFKRYFDQFGTIIDVVVMYDHNTQRPRGFGFITYDSEESVDKVLVKTFHELNGKMVEVKRAVPKELSPGPTRSQSGFSYGLNKLNSLFNGYSSNSSPNYGMRMHDRFSPVTLGRSGYPSYGSSNYSMGLNFDPGFSLNHRASGDSGFGYGRGLGFYHTGSSNRYGSSFGYDMGNGGSGPSSNTTNRNVWGNGSINYGANSVTSNSFVSSATGNAGIINNIGNMREIWGFSPVSSQGGGTGFLNGGNIGYSGRENNVGGRIGYGIINDGNAVTTSSYSTTNVLDSGLGNSYGGESFYGDLSWRESSPDLEGSAFGYGRDAAADIAPNNSIGGYSVAARSNRGIAA